jgi:hypothetical protein
VRPPTASTLFSTELENLQRRYLDAADLVNGETNRLLIVVNAAAEPTIATLTEHAPTQLERWLRDHANLPARELEHDGLDFIEHTTRTASDR